MRLSDDMVTQIYFRCKDDESAPDDYGLGLWGNYVDNKHCRLCEECKEKNLRRWEGTMMSCGGDGVSATPTFCVLRISKDFLVLHPWGPNKILLAVLIVRWQGL